MCTLAPERTESLPQGATIKAEARIISSMTDPVLLGFRLYKKSVFKRTVQSSSAFDCKPICVLFIAQLCLW